MAIVLSGALPTGERNGIGTIADALISDPEQGHIVVAVVTCSKLTFQPHSKKTVATARIVEIEGFAYGSDCWQAARAVLDHQREARTGQVALPLHDNAAG